jgi:predicted nucleotidyltransferase
MVAERFPDPLPEIVRRLREAIAPACIYLFGSRAAGTGQPDSDFDILAVVDRTQAEANELEKQGYLALSGIGVPIDLLVYCRADFEKRSRWSTSLERSVRDSGRIIYAA